MLRLVNLALIVAFVVLAVTNPGQDLHRRAVYESAAEAESPVLEKIATQFRGDADVVPLTYNNYYLFSTTTVNGATASVGAISHVWKMK